MTSDCTVDPVQDLQHFHWGKEMKLHAKVKVRVLRIDVTQGADVADHLRSICHMAKQLSIANGPNELVDLIPRAHPS